MQKSPLTKIIVTVIIALLIPVFSYTTFQFSQKNKDEQLIRSGYQRQLESILFSINQHCWDVFNSWSSALLSIVSTPRGENSNYRARLRGFVQTHISVEGSFIRLTPASLYLVWKHPKTATQHDVQKLQRIIEQNKAPIEKLIRRARKGYIKPLVFTWDRNMNRSISLLLFLPSRQVHNTANPIIAGVFVNDDVFVDEVVARKFAEINDGTFIFAVKEHDSNNILFATDEAEEQSFEKSETLWLLPHLDLQIKLQGTTLEDISKKRVKTNLLFLGLVDLVLLLGVLYMLRSISHEMTLAKLKTDFVANVSHELRTPLALIRMQAETLEMDRVPSEERKKHYYRTIMAESARLTQLINNILDFSRIESNRKHFHFTQHNLADLVRQTLDMYRFHLHQKGFSVREEIDSTLPPVTIDSEAVKQALMNLLDNAVKFSPDEKDIHVSLKQKDHSIVLSVRDKGIGISEAEQKKIFEKFYRTGDSLVHNTKGSGLGLSLVRHIMDAHGGKVVVKSKLGQGSTFTLIFPLKHGES